MAWSPSSEESSSDVDSEESEERRRKAVLVVLLVVLFVLASYGVVATPTEPVPTDLYEAKGDLTVTVESQTGEAVAGREVSLVHPETGKVVASGTTDSAGEVTFRNVEQARYLVRVDGKSTKVSLTSDDEEITIGVTVTPPKSYRSFSARRFSGMAARLPQVPSALSRRCEWPGTRSRK